jgi:outer membrane protein assembly factor BamB
VIVTNAGKHIRGFDAASGRELWRLSDNNTQVKVPTPVVAGDLVIVTGGYPAGGRPIYAIKPGGSGTLSKSALAWQTERGSPYTGTPLVHGDILYVCTDNGILSAYDLKTGDRIYQQRVSREAAGFSASPIAAAIASIWRARKGTSSLSSGTGVQAARHQPHGRDHDGHAGRRRQHAGRPHPVTARGHSRELTSPSRPMPFRHITLTLRRSSLALTLLITAALGAQAPAAGAPADRWPQFRGSAALLGTTAATLPDKLRVLWTYEAGEAVESSAAIADGVVYVGAQPGVLHAIGLADGKPRWKYTASDIGIGESSPAVAGGIVYIGDLSGVVHAVDAASGKAVWTFKTQSEIKSSPVVAGDRVLIGSYDSSLYALGARDGKLLWKVQTEGYVHGTPSVVDGIAYIAGCDEILRAIRISDGKQVFAISSGAYTGASPAIVGGRAYYGTYENEVLAVDLKAHKIVWRYKHPSRNFPFYSSPAVAMGRVFVGGRDKFVHADRA